MGAGPPVAAPARSSRTAVLVGSVFALVVLFLASFRSEAGGGWAARPANVTGARTCAEGVGALRELRTRQDLARVVEDRGFTTAAELGVQVGPVRSGAAVHGARALGLKPPAAPRAAGPPRPDTPPPRRPQRGLFAEEMLAGWPACEKYYLVDAWKQQVGAGPLESCAQTQTQGRRDGGSPPSTAVVAGPATGRRRKAGRDGGRGSSGPRGLGRGPAPCSAEAAPAPRRRTTTWTQATWTTTPKRKTTRPPRRGWLTSLPSSL
jgi:hypothetical protein